MNASSDRYTGTQLAQFSLLQSNLAWIIPVTTLLGLALPFALRGELVAGFGLAWVIAVMTLQVVRALYLRHWRTVPTTSETVQSRLRIATVMSTGTGCLFGLYGYMALSPDKPLVSLLIIMVLTSMVATATAVIPYLVPMYLLYVFPLMLPAGVCMLSFDETNTSWVGGLMFLYLVVNLAASRSISASISRSIELRFENVELLENLKHQHQRAEVALAREEKANLAKSRFLAAASHDLRQPLHSLRLFTATLEMQTRNTQHKTLVNQIDSSVKSLEELFNALLDISKLDAGTVNVEHQHIHLDSLLSHIEGDFRPMAKEKHLNLHVSLDSEVVHTDAILLEQLVRNLVGNAIRYTRSGSVDLSTKVEDGRVWLSISDSGVGIPLSDQKRIFEEFIQLGNAERDRNQGIGLGLSIVKRLADLLDIQIRVESNVGQGATFHVGIPQGDVAQCRFGNQRQVLVSDHVGSLFILVVDDEEEVCLAIEGLLETWGCIVMCANSGDTALQQLREIGDVPDLVISDYRLRDGENGGHVISRIREQLGFELPAIILSGDIAPERLKEIKALGLPFLHKPCEPQALRLLISNETIPGESTSDETLTMDEPVFGVG